MQWFNLTHVSKRVSNSPMPSPYQSHHGMTCHQSAGLLQGASPPSSSLLGTTSDTTAPYSCWTLWYATYFWSWTFVQLQPPTAGAFARSNMRCYLRNRVPSGRWRLRWHNWLLSGRAALSGGRQPWGPAWGHQGPRKTRPVWSWSRRMWDSLCSGWRREIDALPRCC